MDKFTFKTADGVDVNLEKLSQAFPEVITETVGEDGKIKRVADFEKLKMLLGDSAAERPQEFYEFTWPGKNEAIFKAAKATTKTLRPCPEESKNWDTTQNLYIEGDNLEALKILQEAYLGKVKMIYIDPPYNTGKDFVYRDNFHKSAEEGKADETVRDEESDNNLFQNTESNGRFHSDWCSMIYPRLKLARDLLRDDGVIFISIDDNEVHNLRKICDEIFGESNFIDIYNWAKTETPENLSQKSRQIIEYIVCYQKERDNTKFKGIKKCSSSSNGLLNQPNPIGILKFPANVVRTKIEDQILKSGTYGTEKYKVELLNDVIIKNGYFASEFALRAKFKWQQSYLNEELKRGTTITIPTIKISPAYEKLEYSPEVPTNLINKKVGVDTNESAGEHQLKLFGKKVFTFPKPCSLISYLFEFLYNNEKIVVMDFFSGSATTAEAVMNLNATHNNNDISYIMVQIPEDLLGLYNSTKEKSQKEIIQNAIDYLSCIKKPINLCELAKERIRRAGEKIKAEYATTAPNLDIGFRVLKIDESIMKDVFYSPNETSQDLLSTLESNIKEDRTALDLLFACLVDWGVELSMPLRTESIEGVEIHTMSDGDAPALIACFAQNIPETVVRKIAARHPLRAVFRDSSFTDSPAKINLTEIFKTFSPETEIKVL